MISNDDRSALETHLSQMCALHAGLASRHAGICVLHLEAAIASLESHLRRNGVTLHDEVRAGLSAANHETAIETAQSYG